MNDYHVGIPCAAPNILFCVILVAPEFFSFVSRGIDPVRGVAAEFLGKSMAFSLALNR